MRGIFLFLLLSVGYLTVAQAGDNYCERSLKNFQEIALLDENRFSFANEGGLLGGGVCWWHSRLQRNAIYMARFAPDAPIPTSAQASKLVNDLINEKGPVVIGGYKDFYDFSRGFHNMIQNKLEAWQKKDGFFKFSWLRGLKGRHEMEPDELQKEMDLFYQKVVGEGEIVYARLNPAGIEAHSWLIVGMTKRERGYELVYVDSNYPVATLRYDYTIGDVSVDSGIGKSGFYENYSGTLKKLKKNFAKACGRDLK
jgi:hypothetical protein